LIIKEGSAPAHLSNIIILQGDDRLSIEKEIDALTKELDQDVFLGLNKIHLDGSSQNMKEISLQLKVLPLGGKKRIVILDCAQDVIGKKDAQAWLNEELSIFSSTTILVLILEDEKKYRKGKMVWEAIGDNHWLQRTFKKFLGKACWIELPLPSDREMSDWIMKEAERQGGSFHPRAAVELSRLVGNDLFQVQQEIRKAISYVGDDKQVSADVVRKLSSSIKEESVFALVDAIGQRDGKLAFKLFHRISNEMPIQYIFSMLVRQVRLLILAKEALMNNEGEKGVMVYCKLHHTFIAKKLINQVRHFRIKALIDIYRKLDRIDEETKVGRVTLDVALERLIAGIAVT